MTLWTTAAATAVGVTAGLAWGRKDWPPLPAIRRLRHRLRGGPFSDNFRIRVGLGGGPMDFRALDDPACTTLGPELVSDCDAVLIADPFLHVQDGTAWILFEAMERRSRKGVIGAANSRDGRSWTYHQTVLHETCHLSYPFVFTWEGRTWMIPETHQLHSIRLYVSDDFPDGWRLHSTILSGLPFADATPFEHESRWYMFVTVRDLLLLYHADAPVGPWMIHPGSPLRSPPSSGFRCAGRVQAHSGTINRLEQIARPYYGFGVDGVMIESLGPDHLKESSPSPVLRPDRRSSWRPFGCHHFDSIAFGESWLLCSDGF